MADDKDKNEEKGGTLTAAAFWAFLALVVAPNARPALEQFRFWIEKAIESATYTLDHAGLRMVAKGILPPLALTLLLRYTAIAPFLHPGTSKVFWITTVLELVLAAYLWWSVLPVTSDDRAAMREPWDQARQHLDAMRTARLTGEVDASDEAAAEEAEREARMEFQHWEKRAGKSWIGFFLAVFIAWLLFVIQGFGYFLHGETSSHLSVTTVGYAFRYRAAVNEFWFGVMAYAGPLWFFLLYFIPKFVIGPLSRFVSKIERATIRAQHAAEAAGTDGVVLADVEARYAALQKLYHDSFRTATEILRNDLTHFYFGMMLGSFLQVAVARRTMEFAVTIDTATYGIFLLIFCTAVVNKIQDHVPLEHVTPRWVMAINTIPLLPPIYALIVGGDEYGVYSPLSIWRFVARAAGMGGDAVTRPTSHYISQLCGMTIPGALTFFVILVGGLVLLVVFWTRLSEQLKKIDLPIIKWIALPVAVVLTIVLTLVILSVIFRAPTYLDQADGGTDHSSAAPVTSVHSCDLINGRFPCTPECLRAANMLSSPAGIEQARGQGRCY